MKKLILLSILLLLSLVFNNCSVRKVLVTPYTVNKIPLSGKSVINCGTTDHSILLASYNIDHNKNVVEKDINILEYNLKDHQYKQVSQIKNTRTIFIEFYDFLKPFIYTTSSGSRIFFQHRWVGNNYLVTKTENDHEVVIYERKNLSKSRLIDFALVDSQKKNTFLFDFQSGNQFECQSFEILQYDIQTGYLKKIAEESGSLFSVPYYETNSHIYITVKQNQFDNFVFCYRKSNNHLEYSYPIEDQELVGFDYDSDFLVFFNKNQNIISLSKGKQLQETIQCSPFPYAIDRVYIKHFQEKWFFLIIIEDLFDSEKRMLRWIEYDTKTKKTKEINWNGDFRYKLDRGNYQSDKFDYYILAYEKSSRKVALGIIDIIKGTMIFRDTDHSILPGHDFQSSYFLQGNYCFWTEGTTISEESVTSDVQTYNPMAYYCSLEEPLLQKINH